MRTLIKLTGTTGRYLLINPRAITAVLDKGDLREVYFIDGELKYVTVQDSTDAIWAKVS